MVQNYTFIPLSITASIALFFFGRFLLKKYEEYVSLHRHKDELEKKVLPSIEERLKPIPRMDERINMLYNKEFGKELVKSNSPVQLAKKGQEFAEILDSYELIKKYKTNGHL